jgi:putative transcriptional regulator
MQGNSGVVSGEEGMSTYGERLIRSARQALAIAKGEMEPAFIYTDVDVAKIRAKLKMSQAEFADMIQVSKRVVQEWEQRRKAPSGPARALLKVVERAPQTVKRVLKAA